jgi:hypothetical protein
MVFGLMSGSDPVPADWTFRCNARGYGIVNQSNGWVDVLGATRFGIPVNWSEAPLGSVVECTLDMGARTMSFAVDNKVPCVAFADIVGPVRPIIWGGGARLLHVRAAGTGVCSSVRRSARYLSKRIA